MDWSLTEIKAISSPWSINMQLVAPAQPPLPALFLLLQQLRLLGQGSRIGGSPVSPCLCSSAWACAVCMVGEVVKACAVPVAVRVANTDYEVMACTSHTCTSHMWASQGAFATLTFYGRSHMQTLAAQILNSPDLGSLLSILLPHKTHF